ncbi:hypothetical protein GIB67_031585 [Kingdonia uniflora]|uniref:Uncharacterized protein n=1 Tax=Kingdonia uniflora TaxID=39325 RepID=A0A7J7LYG3_9MAGN|nr:hypothetical protein GIB67_031585 [Kingdonia uniflora]
MGTVVLRPQDILRDRFPRQALISPKPKRNPNPNQTRNNRRKRSSSSRSDNSSEDRCGSKNVVVSKAPPPNLLMGKVTILKRGEKLNLDQIESKIVKSDDLVLFSTDRLGPDPMMVPKQIRLTDLKSEDDDDDIMFAGSVIVASPSPKSLPMPAFFKSSNKVATTEIRRLLNLDLV